jgi:hypothetical protein
MVQPEGIHLVRRGCISEVDGRQLSLEAVWARILSSTSPVAHKLVVSRAISGPMLHEFPTSRPASVTIQLEGHVLVILFDADRYEIRSLFLPANHDGYMDSLAIDTHREGGEVCSAKMSFFVQQAGMSLS